MAVEPQDFTCAARRIGGQVMRLLGWSPDIFWAATPEDVAMALSAFAADAPDSAAMARNKLQHLQELFPDG